MSQTVSLLEALNGAELGTSFQLAVNNGRKVLPAIHTITAKELKGVRIIIHTETEPKGTGEFYADYPCSPTSVRVISR